MSSSLVLVGLVSDKLRPAHAARDRPCHEDGRGDRMRPPHTQGGGAGLGLQTVECITCLTWGEGS